MHLQPYVFFDGLCEEAIEFYRGAIGAEVVMLMHYKDNPDPQAHRPAPRKRKQGNACHPAVWRRDDERLGRPLPGTAKL